MVRYDFDGKTALVTGAARGRRRSHAVRYAEHGANVVATDGCETLDAPTCDLSGREELEEAVALAEEHGVEALGLEIDVTDEATVEAAVDTPMTGGIVESIDDDVAEIAEQSGPDDLLDGILQPEDVNAAVTGLSSEDARFVTGIALPVAAGATAL